MKNRFANPLFTGIRDLLINFRVDGHICEVQVHLSHLLALKHTAHKYYSYFRDYFVGTDESYKIRMELFSELGHAMVGRNGQADIESGIAKILLDDDDTNDVDTRELEVLEQISGHEIMSDGPLNFMAK